ncbi:MAG: hypothetical protein AB7S81_07755 [Bdellovibrionales bacterium]
MEPEKELTPLKKLEYFLDGTNGLVQAAWGYEPSEQVDVLKLFIEASAAFQIRAFKEAMEAARINPASVIKMDVGSFFSVEDPAFTTPNGHLSIAQKHLFDPKYLPHVQQAITALKKGKKRADKFDLKDIEQVVGSAFGSEVVKCETTEDARVKAVISYPEFSDFREQAEEFGRRIRSMIMENIPEQLGKEANLSAECWPVGERGGQLRLGFNPAYAEEFSMACCALRGKLSPQVVLNQLAP